MAVVEGTHVQGDGGKPIGYRVEYDVVDNTIHYKATFAGGADAASAHEGQFDFDPARIDAEAAVDAFMQNHIGKANFDIAP